MLKVYPHVSSKKILESQFFSQRKYTNNAFLATFARLRQNCVNCLNGIKLMRSNVFQILLFNSTLLHIFFLELRTICVNYSGNSYIFVFWKKDDTRKPLVGRSRQIPCLNTLINMTSILRRFFENRMEVGMLVNNVNASSVFLKNWAILMNANAVSLHNSKCDIWNTIVQHIDEVRYNTKHT